MDQLLNIKYNTRSLLFKSSPCSKQSFQSEDDRDTALSSDFTPKPKPKPLQGLNPMASPFDNEDSDKSSQKGESVPKTFIPKLSRFSTQRVITMNEGDKDEEPEVIEKEIKQCSNIQLLQPDDQNKTIEEQLRKIEEKIKVNPKLKQIKSKPMSMRSFKNFEQSKEDKLMDHPFRHLIFSPKIDELVFEKHLIVTQRGLIYSRKCLKGPSEQFLEKKKVILNKINPNKVNTIFLDLDETLIHACNSRETPSVKLKQQNEDGSEIEVGINVRPYTNYFLQELAQFYTIYIYTASSQQYAQTIVNYLDPLKQYISGILSRSNCMETKNGFFIKDLRIIKDLDLNRTLIIDNLVHSFGLQVENGIPILEWHENQEDLELKYLLEYLIEASEKQNLKDFNIAHLQLDNLLDYVIKQ
ncbi:unnamed protein product [Paramecium pentaurelia]|uniref:Mitochondrial import inner membrane translocase subunit TIM50 n=1 Tax=Paramecium pentaurelia TaxID=43138 RepID=A0A8S1S6I7_9CILI|nr:unnamed protein product [Paramecium pentaurelia]